jgi:hypothetical protein
MCQLGQSMLSLLFFGGLMVAMSCNHHSLTRCASQTLVSLSMFLYFTLAVVPLSDPVSLMGSVTLCIGLFFATRCVA